MSEKLKAAQKFLKEEKERKKIIIAEILHKHNYIVESEDLEEWLDIIEEFDQAADCFGNYGAFDDCEHCVIAKECEHEAKDQEEEYDLESEEP